MEEESMSFEELDYRLEDLIETQDILTIIDQKYPAAILGAGRYAEQYHLRRVRIGGSWGFHKDDVREMIIDLFEHPRRFASDITSEEREKNVKEALSKFDKVVSEIKDKREGNLSDYWIDKSAMEYANVTVREALYQKADYRPKGVIRTQLFGRTRLYLIDDVKKVWRGRNGSSG